MKKPITWLILSVVLAACAGTNDSLGELPKAAFENQAAACSTYTVLSSLNSGGTATLNDGVIPATFADISEATTWHHEGNFWDPADFPMQVTLDLGASCTLSNISYYVGEIRSLGSARMTLEVSGNNVVYSSATSLPVGDFSKKVSANVNVTGRYVRLSFASDASQFDISELTFIGKQVSPYPPVEGLEITKANAVLGPDTVVLNPTQSRAVTSFTGTRLSTTGALSLNVGDIVVSGPTDAAPSGIFVKVLNKTGTTYTVETANFEEAYETFELDMTKTLSASEIVSTEGPDIAGSAITTQQLDLAAISTLFDDFAVCDADGNLLTTNDQLRVRGSIDFDPALFLNIDLGFFRLRNFETGIDWDNETTLTLEGECDLPFIDEMNELYSYIFAPIIFTVGPVPVVIIPVVRLFIGADGSVQLDVDLEVQHTLSGRTGVMFERGEGWDGFNEITDEDLDFVTAEANARLEVRNYLQARVGLSFYGAVELYVGVEPYAEFSATATQELELTLCGTLGLDGVWGGDIRIFTIKEELFARNFGDIINPTEACSNIVVDTPIPDPPAPPPPPAISTFTVSYSGNASGVQTLGGTTSFSCPTTGSCTGTAPTNQLVTIIAFGPNASQGSWSGCEATRTVNGGGKECDVRVRPNSSVSFF